jgi:membrane protein DedA with SNARE-associated domain
MIGKWLLALHIRLLALYQLPLAALVSLDTLRDALTTLGYPAVALFIMIESAGIPFPGETMLLLASFYAAVDHRLQIPIVIACAAFGAIIGDNIGYLVGRTGGYALVQRFGRYVFLKPHHLQKARQFFARHGNKTVFLGRFVAVLRAWAAFLAGVNHMPWPIFLIYNAAGGVIWAIIYGCLGFYAGRIFHDNFGAVEHLAKTISWTGAVLIVVVVLVAYILFRLRRKRHHEQQTAEEQNSTTEIVPAEAQQELTATASEQQIPPLASTPTTPIQPEQESASEEQQETLSSPEAK